MTSHSPVNRTYSMRRASESQSPETYATPTASQSAIGRWIAVSISVDPPGMKGYTFANTAPATKIAARAPMPFLLSPRFQTK